MGAASGRNVHPRSGKLGSDAACTQGTITSIFTYVAHHSSQFGRTYWIRFHGPDGAFG
jgi:hypothetical protein